MGWPFLFLSIPRIELLFFQAQTLPMKHTLLFALALVLSILTISASTQQPKTQWEYKFDDKCYEKKTNDMAAQGWELMQIDSFTYKDVTGLTCVFRRAK